MKQFKGKEIFVFIGGVAVACCTDCSFDGNAEMIPVSGEDAEWEEYECGKIDWGIQSSHIIDSGNAGTMLRVGESAQVAFADKKDGTIDEEGFRFLGDAVIAQAQFNGAHKDLCRGQFAFRGDGALFSGIREVSFITADGKKFYTNNNRKFIAITD